MAYSGREVVGKPQEELLTAASLSRAGTGSPTVELVATMRALASLERLDVRWFYSALLLGIVLVYFVRIPVRIEAGREARGFYDAIEGLDGSKPVLVHSDWDQGTIGELREQFRNLIHHLFRKNIRFVIVSGVQTGREFYEPVINDIAREYGKAYGEDWATFGFKMPDPKALVIESIAADFPAHVRVDDFGSLPTSFAWLQRVKVAEDWALVVDISYGPYLEYITYFYSAARVPVIAGVASISSTNMYPALTAGTIKGMLIGARGGGEYEQLLGRAEFGTRFLLGQSAGHILVLLAILLGNLGHLATKRSKRK